MAKVRGGTMWVLVLIAAIILLILSLTGRLGILTAIAILPDKIVRKAT